jgi:hypothetical protein
MYQAFKKKYFHSISFLPSTEVFDWLLNQDDSNVRVGAAA